MSIYHLDVPEHRKLKEHRLECDAVVVKQEIRHQQV